MLVQRDDLARFLRPLADEQQRWLAALVTRRRQLLTMLGIAEQFKLNPNTILWANLEDLASFTIYVQNGKVYRASANYLNKIFAISIGNFTVFS